jgi:hypothetical protein
VVQHNFQDCDGVRLAQMPQIEAHIISRTAYRGGAWRRSTRDAADRSAIVNVVYGARAPFWGSMGGPVGDSGVETHLAG